MNDKAMKEMLKGCSLHSLLMLTSKVLTRSGFGDVEILDRRQSKERSRYGGHELECTASFGFVPMRVIVKVVNDSVRVRMLDELAGTVARRNADLGMIVTPHHLTTKAKLHQGIYRRMRVHAVDGTDLAQLLQKCNIGTRGHADVDYAFFGALEDVSSRLLSFIASGR